MKKILRISLLLIVALVIISLTSKVEAKNYGVKTVYLKVGESVTLGQKNSKLTPDIPYEDKSGLGYIDNGKDIRNYKNSAFKVEVGKETKDRTIKITGTKSGSGTLIVKFHPNSSGTSNLISFRVYVSDVPVKEVTVTTKNVELKPNEGKQLAASISPSNATNKNLKWSILRGGEYVSVTTSGYVTAKNVKNSGEALIQVMTEDNSTSAACTVKVKATDVNTTNINNNTNSNNTNNNSTNTTTNTTTNNTKQTNTTTNKTTNNNASRHNTSTKPQVGNEYLKVNDKIKFTATSWYLYSKDTLALSTIKSKTLKHGDICIVKSIDGNAVQVIDENNKDLGYIYWNNTSTGAKSNFEKVSSGNKTTNSKSETTVNTQSCSKVLKLFSNILQKIMPETIDITKQLTTILLQKTEEILKEEQKETEKTETKKDKCGDVNCDGSVDAKDETYLKRYLANWEGYTLTEQGKLNADVNVDQKIDDLDADILRKYVAGSYTSLPVKTTTMYGDINCDKKVNEEDIKLLEKHILKNTEITDKQKLENADVNLDGKIDGFDFQILSKYIAGEIKELPLKK